MNNKIDITRLSLIELKALIYDKSTDFNIIKKEIEIINNEIQNRVTQQIPEEKEEKLKKK